MAKEVKFKSIIWAVALHLCLGGAALASMEYIKKQNIAAGEQAITITFKAPPEKPAVKPKQEKKSVPAQIIKPLPEVAPMAETKPSEQQATAKPQTTSHNIPADYNSKIYAWLEKHKHYPRAAKISRIEGRAILSFKIDENGKLLEYSITESAGSHLLDKAVEDMIQAADPLPSPKEFAESGSLKFKVPVAFKLN